LMVSIYALGGVSGGNFNPAVSIALGLSSKMEWKEVGIYCVVQVIAGICAGLSFAAMLFKVVNVAPKPGFGWWEAMLAEVLYTFVLCFVVLNCAASTKNGCGSLDGQQQFYGLAIGFVVIAGGYGAGAISGGAFNPAVALGLDVSSAGVGFGWGFAYTGYEIVGSALAATLFRVVRPDDFGGSADYDLGTRCVSEFIGTFVLVLTVGLNVLGGSPAGAWSIAASLTVMIFALGNCSGAHFNPAVTIAIVISGRDKCPLRDAGAYIATQLVAGVCASYTYAGMHHGKSFPLEPVAPYAWSQALGAEFVYTFVLCFVVLSVATVKSPLSQYFGLAIGSCVTVGGIAIGNVSGGSLNPAVSTGISAARIIGGGLFYNCIIYSIAEIAGAVAAAFVFKFTHPSEYAKGRLPIFGAMPVRP